jgi:hypothetical protein
MSGERGNATASAAVVSHPHTESARHHHISLLISRSKHVGCALEQRDIFTAARSQPWLVGAIKF